MKINHIALWVKDLELSRWFYMKYFGLESNEKYISKRQPLETYFLTSTNDAAFTKIELMYRPDMEDLMMKKTELGFGWAHIALSLGSKDAVDTTTDQLRNDGYNIVGEPRITGDGYYESIIEDMDGNWIELTI